MHLKFLPESFNSFSIRISVNCISQKKKCRRSLVVYLLLTLDCVSIMCVCDPNVVNTLHSDYHCISIRSLLAFSCTHFVDQRIDRHHDTLLSRLLIDFYIRGSKMVGCGQIIVRISNPASTLTNFSLFSPRTYTLTPAF